MFVLAVYEICASVSSPSKGKEDQIRRHTLRRGIQTDCIMSFKGTLTLSQLMTETETQTHGQFQLVRVEAGGDSCQGDKSCEHEV